jgi:broad specificity phosphatase PhoE
MRPSQQKWMDHLVIVRHAESPRNVGKQVAQAAGRSEHHGGMRDMDVPLTPRGRKVSG